MFEIIAVTSRALCRGDDFPGRIGAIAASGVEAVILREKDMPPEEYRRLAVQAAALCRLSGTEFIAHTFFDEAVSIGCKKIHLPLPLLEKIKESREVPRDIITGTSVHSVEDARKAASLGAGYLIAGHVFETRSKKGLEGRGLHFLSEICRQSPVPVYAIGGISEHNIASVRKTGAAGACLMSSFMTAVDPKNYVAELRRNALDCGPA
ncbi:MAG: thiamine phosphate synthase [Synergistaceae bacterium]|jgi:thiamine-phosphate pyrophosphorylase|nr:thiamine phosphate synthase [Synergistaceae bacterium]